MHTRLLLTAATTVAIGAASSQGLAAEPGLRTSSSWLFFESTPVGSTTPPRSVTVVNDGPAGAKIAREVLIGPDAADFAITGDTCLGSSLGHAASCSVGVTFTPRAAKVRGADLQLIDSAACSHFVHLAGNGAAVTATARAATSGCPTTTSDATASTPTASAAPAPKASSQVVASDFASAPVAKLCTSRRRFRVHFARPRSLEHVTITVAGRRVRSLGKGRIHAVVDLRGLPRRRFTLVVRMTLTSGRHTTLRRHYVTCVAP